MMFQAERCIRCTNGELKQHPTEFHLFKECPFSEGIVWQVEEVFLTRTQTTHRNTTHCPKYYPIDALAKNKCLSCEERRRCKLDPISCERALSLMGEEGGEIE